MHPLSILTGREASMLALPPYHLRPSRLIGLAGLVAKTHARHLLGPDVAFVGHLPRVVWEKMGPKLGEYQAFDHEERLLDGLAEVLERTGCHHGLAGASDIPGRCLVRGDTTPFELPWWFDPFLMPGYSIEFARRGATKLVLLSSDDERVEIAEDQLRA